MTDDQSDERESDEVQQPDVARRLALLDQLQQASGRDVAAADRWIAEVRAERRAGRL